MHGEQHPSKIALRAQRERVLERLSEGFVRDELGLDEFERRIDDAYGAQSVEALTPLIVDLEPALAESLPLVVLPRAAASAGFASSAQSSALAVSQRVASRSLAVFGNVERRGRFQLEDGSQAVAVFGNIELDLRQVTLAPGVTTLHVRAVLGNIEITVPPDLALDCQGVSVLGSFASVNRVPPAGSAPTLLRIVGSAVLGNVEVRTRPVGLQPGGPRRLR